MKSFDPQKPLFHVLLIALFCLIAYSNTFSVPFHFDDEPVIVENPIIKDLHYFLEPSKASGFTGHFEYSTLKSRYVGYLTFALNYRLHGFDVTGYHVFNLLAHTGNALLVYLLVILTLKTPYFNNLPFNGHSRYMAALTALLFACHPLQTQAVTYVFQRVTSLATTLYLLSLVSYITWRLRSLCADTGVRGFFNAKTLSWYMLSVIAAVLSMKTKEIAIMLPVTVVLFELFFFRGNIAIRFFSLLPLLLTLLIIPFSLIGSSLDKPVADILGEAGEAARGATSLSRWEYLLTGFRVIVTYIRLVFLPVQQNLDYDYPIFHSFFEPEVLASFVFLAIILGAAIYLLYRSRHGDPRTRLVAFGIFWFFINLSLESTVIPLNNVIFEHRMYLPSAGVFIALSSSLFLWLDRLKERSGHGERAFVPVLITMLLLLTGATYSRNSVWNSETGLWEDVVRKSPDKARGHTNLGNAYKKQGATDKAVHQYRIAIQLNPLDYKARSNLCASYNTLGLFQKAEEQCSISIRNKPDYPSAYNNLGNTYLSMGLIDRAIEQYRTATRLSPYFFMAHYNLGKAYRAQGLSDKAIEHYQLAIELDGTSVKARNNLGNIYQSLGLIDRAIEQYRFAIELAPSAPASYINLGNAFMSRNLVDEAVEQYRIAVRLDPESTSAHQNLGFAYEAKGLQDKAEEQYDTVSRLREGQKAGSRSQGLLKANGES